MGEIYGIFSKIDNRIIYIGQTIIGFENRFKKHIRQCKSKTKCAIHNKMNKNGLENFYPLLLMKCEKKFLNENEILFIKKYDTYKNGLNETAGGETMSGYKHKEVTKQKIGEKLKKRWIENREIIIESLKKRPPRKQSVKEIMWRSEYFKKNNPCKKLKVKQKISNSHKNKYENGYVNPNSGKWKITKPNNETIIVTGLKNFCKKNNLGYSGMYYAFKNKIQYHGYKIEKVI